jgi:hypothetical protein
MRKLKLLLFFCLAFTGLFAQEVPSPKKEKQDYFRKEEIIFDGKRYRIHNSYLSLGPGFLQSTLRTSTQRALGIDFQFPIRRSHFQLGVMMSGEGFSSNNNVQAHICYGLRRERTRTNLAAFAGPSYFTGVRSDAASGLPVFYSGWGGYLCLQAVRKFTYDMGLGVELFGEISREQNVTGIKLIVFFSGSYRGPKKNFNPNVRSENPR